MVMAGTETELLYISTVLTAEVILLQAVILLPIAFLIIQPMPTNSNGSKEVTQANVPLQSSWMERFFLALPKHNVEILSTITVALDEPTPSSVAIIT